jgi:hypothetical protein
MKTYQIELKRVSYVNLTIEADSLEKAKAQAWEQVEADYYRDDGAWEIESIELDEPATDDSRSYGSHHQDEDQFYGPSCRI